MIQSPTFFHLKTSCNNNDLTMSIDVLNSCALFMQIYQNGQRAKMDIQWIHLIANMMDVIRENTFFLKLKRVDFVPAYTSLLIQFDSVDNIHSLKKSLSYCLEKQFYDFDENVQKDHKVLELSVYYGGEWGRDLQSVANSCGLSVAEVVRFHTETTYHVFALGFSLGFAFMGQVNQKLRLPRHATPRKKVLAGTVAIAENQTAIYPRDSPGGWHGIGYCSQTLFDVNRAYPSLFHLGQKVKFKSVSKVQRNKHQKVLKQTDLNNNVMDPAFKVISAQGTSQYVDLGRASASHLGLTSSGPMDCYAFSWANHLLGNTANSVELEISWGGLSLLCLAAVDIAITGADLQTVITRHGQEKRIVPWLAYHIQAGEILTFKGYCHKGLRAYLAVKNGFRFSYPSVFNSYSTVVKEQLGGRDNAGIPLQVEELLSVAPNAGNLSLLTGVPYRYRIVIDNRALLTIKLRFCYQAHEVATQILELFLSQTYTISQQMDRVAYRLQCVTPILLHWSKPLNSEGIALGSIQITPDGEPIIMMRDRPTIGGYPKIAVISAKDINILAQAVTGQKIIFIESTE